MVGNKVMNECIDSRSTVASSYAQFQQQHLQTGIFDNDVNSVLTASSSQKIPIW
jgi:hypothetical protein